MLTQEQVIAADKFSMPAVGVGEIVEYMPSLHERNNVTAAIVVRVGERSINLHVFKSHNGGVKFIDGVRHMEDPIAADKTLYTTGIWRKQRVLGDWGQVQRNFADLEKEVAALKARVLELEEQAEADVD